MSLHKPGGRPAPLDRPATVADLRRMVGIGVLYSTTMTSLIVIIVALVNRLP